MRSFFRRPSWASRGDENPTFEFYRRAGQVCEDIITASKEAKENAIRSSSESFPTEYGRTKKRRHISIERMPKGGTSPEIDDQLKHIAHPDDQQEAALLSCQSHSSDIPREETGGSEQQPVGKTPTCDASTTNQHDHAGFECERVMIPQKHQKLDIGSVPCVESRAKDKKSAHQHEDNLQTTPESNFGRHLKTKHEDAIVQILITSRLENTKPLIICRRLSQSLRDVRLAWCERQNLPAEVRASVYLTWKGRRLFDVTTCKSLGLSTKAISLEGDDETNDLVPFQNRSMRVHMEAITEELITLKAQSFSTKPHPQMSMECVRAQANPIKIVMKCPGYDHLQMEVDSNVRVLQLIKAFRQANCIAVEQDINLVFDGDRLSPDSRLTDYEITDDDLIDVLVR